MFYFLAKVAALTAVAASRGHLGVEVVGAATVTMTAQHMRTEEVAVAGYTCECFSLSLLLSSNWKYTHRTHTMKRVVMR